MSIRLSDHFTYGRLLRFTLPSIAMMIFTSIYGVVDGYFVSNFAGKTPFSAVNLIMPFIMIVSTVGFMLGTGGTALVSKTFGEQDPDRANSLFSLFVYVAFVLGILFSVLGIVFLRPIAAFLGATGELLDCCVLYGRIVVSAMPFFILQVMFQSFFITAEKPQLGFIVTVAGGVTNMIGDVLLVTLLPQEHKLAGAAIATALSQVVGGGVPLIYFFGKNKSILRLGKTRFEGCAILKACTNGMSELVNSASMSIVGMLFNRQLLKYAGEDGVAAYGVMMYVSMMFMAVFIGYSIGTAPVIGYHYGAQNRGELKNLLKKSITMLLLCSVLMAAAAEALAVPLSKLFVGYDEGLMKLTISGFRIFALMFLFMGISMFGSGFFTALNDGVTSAIISFLRTMVFEAGTILILPLLFGVNGIWFATVVAEAMAFLLTFIFLLAKRKKYGYL
ncbi:MAG: MATE family efflux transporter [Clostridia bacterium]|nr:MATE family efflux transporter [Clostridia bacterium]